MGVFFSLFDSQFLWDVCMWGAQFVAVLHLAAMYVRSMFNLVPWEPFQVLAHYLDHDRCRVWIRRRPSSVWWRFCRGQYLCASTYAYILVCLIVCLFLCLFISSSVPLCAFFCSFRCFFLYLSICLFVPLFVCFFVCLFFCLVCLFACLSSRAWFWSSRLPMGPRPPRAPVRSLSAPSCRLVPQINASKEEKHFSLRPTAGLSVRNTQTKN